MPMGSKMLLCARERASCVRVGPVTERPVHGLESASQVVKSTLPSAKKGKWAQWHKEAPKKKTLT